MTVYKVKGETMADIADAIPSRFSHVFDSLTAKRGKIANPEVARCLLKSAVSYIFGE